LAIEKKESGCPGGPGPAALAPLQVAKNGRAQPGSPAAVGSLAPKCLGRTKADKPCGGTTTGESGHRYCPWHDPAHTAEEKRLWAARGAIKGVQQRALAAIPPELLPELPSLGTSAGVKQYIERIAQKAEAGQLNGSTVTAIKGLIDSAIRLGELAIEREMLEAELAAHDGAQPRVRLGAAT
jgi:hypothetical protein